MASDDGGDAGDGQGLGVLREIWSANAQSSEQVEEQLRGSRTKVCRNMRTIGFGAMAHDEPAGEDGTNTPVDTDMRAAWREQLRNEGKLHPNSVSVGAMTESGGLDHRRHD
ncbi:hypothetical protein [Pseudonocardia endophytica]|uniref:Uncharacterized protein n=1 Tax=Pseudonocardia endophytica TaxID=401976 RepID=A0A4R1HWX0_PSEEN|nr:hypothetical protein [Pseudonocardia endophytica]TCK27244.1 hypothetical protein EV378_3111 [Pseudonocardia endophytica]